MILNNPISSKMAITNIIIFTWKLIAYEDLLHVLKRYNIHKVCIQIFTVLKNIRIINLFSKKSKTHRLNI